MLLEELEPLASRFTDEERVGLDFFVDWLKSSQEASSDGGVARAKRDFERLEPKLRRDLSRIETSLVPGAAEPSLGRVLAGLVRHHAADLAALLEAIDSVDNAQACHQARIAAKRLRYLVEPLRPYVPSARKLVSRMKGLQDVLGDLHDVHVLLEQLREVLPIVGSEARFDALRGIDAIGTFAQEREKTLFEAWVAQWRGEPLEAMLEAVQAMATGIESDVSVETERKYLLRALPPIIEAPGAAYDAAEIEQGWLPGERLRERLRRKRTSEGESYRRTIKLGNGLSRVEVEEPLDETLFGALWPLTEGCRVRKRRHRVVEGALVWEIDEFLDRDLVLAEVELAAESIRPAFPSWLEPYVIAEVTGDPQYVNLNLAR